MHDATITDLTKAVMTDASGKWHLVPAEHVNDFVSSGRNSVIVHQCPQWSEDIRSPIKELPFEPLGYWTLPKHIQAPCRLCEQRVPEAIANLFMLHNFDTFAGDSYDLGRMINNALDNAMMHQEHTYLLGCPSRCPCRACNARYGAWE